MKNILIVEDEQRLARNISQTLMDEGYRTAIAYDGDSGLQRSLEEPFDLVILDINLPGINGYEVCRQLRAANEQLLVIMLTALGEVEDKLQGFERGADDYMVKPFDLRELTARVATCLRRTAPRPEVHEPEEILQLADLTLNRKTRQVLRGGHTIVLTAKEFSLLEYMLQNPDRVLSKQELTERVWQLRFDPGTNVVEVYINYLRKKIDKDYTPKLIHTRSGQGYVLAIE
ncbi:response regulator [Rudanella paleaurantiibacter]|uniref:Response regulator n=1 Tax=Rudanella paleaurantiibacter TaxID=2614655 RepID=A0A7J5U192_9BACT|nr:response regulator transcription factor [Rudanella paleaurantiibacter]KAB7731573.1 response regulator [Rudanella paleaurantiibacter]